MSDDTIDDIDPAEEADASGHAAVEAALQQFFAAAFQPGATLTHEWLQAALGMPERNSANSFEAFQKWQYAYMARFAEFQKTLLLSHNIALANVFGKGYKIVLPNEQTAWALHEAGRELRKAFSKGMARATHLNIDALTPAERASSSADLNWLRALRELVRKDEAAARARAARAGMVGPQ